MINGLKVTEIPLVISHQSSHRKKLKSIASKKFSFTQHVIPEKQSDSFLMNQSNNSRSHYSSHSLSQSRYKALSGMSPHQQERYEKTKQNHLKSISFHKFKKESMIQHENTLIYEKLLSIKKRKDLNNLPPSLPVSPKNDEKIFRKPQKKMAKDFVYRKKQFMAIQSTNAEIGKRIMNQTGYYDHERDEQNFSKTRQILNRLNRFQIVQRKMGNNKRSKTVPDKLPKLNTELLEKITSNFFQKPGPNPFEAENNKKE